MPTTALVRRQKYAAPHLKEDEKQVSLSNNDLIIDNITRQRKNPALYSKRSRVQMCLYMYITSKV